MSWERDKWGGCKCHHQTFCPDWQYVGEDEQGCPVFYRKADLAKLAQVKKPHKKLNIDVVVYEA